MGYNQKYNINDGDVFFTRLHVRYGRDEFPQDLFFQETPNKEYFQGRYVLRHPAQGELDCEEVKGYYKTVYERRLDEVQNLARLTGWNTSQSYEYVGEYARKAGVLKINKGSLSIPTHNAKGDMQGYMFAGFIFLSLLVTARQFWKS